MSPHSHTIRRTDDLPAYVRSLLSLMTDAQKATFGTSFLALEVADNTAIILVAEEKWSSHDQESYARLVMEKGFSVDGYRQCDRQIIESMTNAEIRNQVATMHHGDSEATQTLNSLLAYCVQEEVSDLHFERRDDATQVRTRIHGDLFTYRSMDKDAAEDVTRVMMTTRADEGNKPATYSATEMQQGSMTAQVGGVMVKLRFQSTPAYTITGDGQDVVARVLVMSGLRTKLKSIAELGYTEEQRQMLEMAKSAPDGSIIFAGGTGSGKSTSLDNVLSAIIAETGGRKKIFTVEDPNEFIIPGTTQIPVTRKKDAPDGYNPFAEAMRTAMRADPDIIMVGEVRDEASAQLVQRMITSGHMVLTTLHTGSAIKIPMRLYDLGIERASLAMPGFFNALCYQKLLQVVCPECSIPYKDSELYQNDKPMLERIHKITDGHTEGIRVRNSDGCPVCKKRGIIGRTVCAEVIVPDYTLLDYFREGRETDAIKHWRGTTGIQKTSLGSAVEKMKRGLVTPDQLEDAYGKAYLQEMEI